MYETQHKIPTFIKRKDIHSEKSQTVFMNYLSSVINHYPLCYFYKRNNTLNSCIKKLLIHMFESFAFNFDYVNHSR